MTAPVAKPAARIAVGDRILPNRLPSTYAEGPGEVVYVKPHVYRGNSSVFVAYVHEDGYYDSTSYLPGSTVEVLPAIPEGHGYSRADDDPEATQPITGRLPAHLEDGETGAVIMLGGLPEVDCSPACKDPNRPDRGVHFLGCPAYASPMPAYNPMDSKCPKCHHWPWPGRHGETGCHATGGTLHPCGCTYAEAAS